MKVELDFEINVTGVYPMERACELLDKLEKVYQVELLSYNPIGSRNEYVIRIFKDLISEEEVIDNTK